MNFYPRSPCGERRLAAAAQGCGAGISIHALLAESDLVQETVIDPSSISIHALLAESDLLVFGEVVTVTAFLSTLSLRRATWCIGRLLVARRYFYPRSPCGERRSPLLPGRDPRHFYPRSPCGERPPVFR